MISVEQALQKMLDRLSDHAICETENVPLAQGLNRVLADNIVARENVPGWDNSAMDGFAVNTGQLSTHSNPLKVSQRITAGSVPAPLKPNTAARIFTGAMMPEGADAVVMQEQCEFSSSPQGFDHQQLDGQWVWFSTEVRFGQNIRRRGQDMEKGRLLFSDGHRLTPQDIGLLAAQGVGQLKVFRKLRVALLCTGDELVQPGECLPPAKLFDANGPMLLALLQQLDVDGLNVHYVVDDLAQLMETLRCLAQTADLILTTGGVSVGEEDHVKKAVSQVGSIDFWKVHMKPGKPVAFGEIRDERKDKSGTAMFLGLPGNPVAAFVTGLLLMQPLVQRLQGVMKVAPLTFQLPALFQIDKPRARPEYARAQISSEGVTLFDNQSSGVLSSVCWGNALVLIPPDVRIESGDLVQVYPY